jgi:hypothetical protein
MGLIFFPIGRSFVRLIAFIASMETHQVEVDPKN